MQFRTHVKLPCLQLQRRFASQEQIMTRYPFYFRLILVAGILSSATLITFSHQPWRLIFLSLPAGLFVWGMILLYLRKTGKSYWDGPNWGERFQAWPGSNRVLAVLPGICAALIPALFLLNRQLGLSDGQL